MITSGVESRVLYIGASSDTKPLGNVEFAAKFYEHDTGKVYIWTGSQPINQGTDTGVGPIGFWVEYIPLCKYSAQDLFQDSVT